MIKRYILPSIMLVLFIVSIVFIVMALFFELPAIGNLKVLSINDIKSKNAQLEAGKALYSVQEMFYNSAIEAQDVARLEFDAAKKEYDDIDDAVISQVEEALKGINYYVDWLWIEVGNYAEHNGLDLTIQEPSNSQFSSGVAEGAITITVVGLYQDIVDFIFDIENDNDLKFKLDNISMSYLNTNYMKATFKVLNMNVLFKD